MQHIKVIQANCTCGFVQFITCSTHRKDDDQVQNTASSTAAASQTTVVAANQIRNATKPIDVRGADTHAILKTPSGDTLEVVGRPLDCYLCDHCRPDIGPPRAIVVSVSESDAKFLAVKKEPMAANEKIDSSNNNTLKVPENVEAARENIGSSSTVVDPEVVEVAKENVSSSSTVTDPEVVQAVCNVYSMRCDHRTQYKNQAQKMAAVHHTAEDLGAVQPLLTISRSGLHYIQQQEDPEVSQAAEILMMMKYGRR